MSQHDESSYPEDDQKKEKKPPIKRFHSLPQVDLSKLYQEYAVPVFPSCFLLTLFIKISQYFKHVLGLFFSYRSFN